MKISYKTYNLKFRHPFTISKGTKTHQPTLIVMLEHFGIRGYGEAPAITYYDITVEKMVEDLQAKHTLIERFAFTEPDRYWHFLHHLLPKNSFLVCALDMAAWDIFGKISRKPLHQLWKGDITKSPLTDYTIGIDTIEKMTNKLKERPWPIYKIKVGTADDIGIVKALRNQTDAVLRVDANAGWDLETALQLIPQLKELGVELVEQPLAKDNWEGMKVLFEQSALPLIADESCVTEADVDRVARYFDGFNIKLVKCGGLTPARRMARRGADLQRSVMVGCMLESSVLIAAGAVIAQRTTFADLDGAWLLGDDPFTGWGFDRGALKPPLATGLGVEPGEDFRFD